MKIFSASQIRACDAYTIHATSITSYELMERAAARCVSWLTQKYATDTAFVVLCGSGNNGGDGLAITRILQRQGFSVKAFLLKLSDSMSEDCEKNLDRLNNIDSSLVEELPEDSLIADIPDNVVIIDAILGTGLNRPAEGWVANFISHINELPQQVISIDIPSGMPADSIPREDLAIIQADYTLSFQFYKRTFLHREIGVCTGKVEIIDIGLSETFIQATPTSYHIITGHDAHSILRPRADHTHKGDYGNALIVAGNKGMLGAAILTTRATICAGAGKTTVQVPECGYEVLQSTVPGAMCITSGETCISRIKEWENSTVGIGPGLGKAEQTSLAVADFITACKSPVVIDADALNLIADNPDLMHRIPADSILTPHPLEFERLFGKSKNTVQMLELARTQCMKYNFYIVVKGRYSVVVTPEGDCYYNMTGNPGMAKGGSGDVLTGILTALLAQGYSSEHAAKLGVYLHGLAGDFAASKYSEYAMMPSNIVEHLGKAFQHVLAIAN